MTGICVALAVERWTGALLNIKQGMYLLELCLVRAGYGNLDLR